MHGPINIRKNNYKIFVHSDNTLMKYHFLQNCYQKHSWNIQNIETELKILKVHWNKNSYIKTSCSSLKYKQNFCKVTTNQLPLQSCYVFLLPCLLPQPQKMAFLVAMSSLFGKRVLLVQGLKKKKHTHTLINSQSMCVCVCVCVKC